MSAQEQKSQEEQKKCKECQVFYASEAFNGCCSGCFKKSNQMKKDFEKTTENTNIVSIESEITKEKTKAEQTDKNRCFDCKKKVGSLGTECKCGFVFCNKHKMPEDHQCSFDFLNFASKNLEKNLIKIEHKKVESIS